MISQMHSVYERARATYWLRHAMLSNHLFNIAHFVKKKLPMLYSNQHITAAPGWLVFLILLSNKTFFNGEKEDYV